MATTSQPAAAPLVIEERAGAVTFIRLNRPEKLNALNLQLAQDLVHALLRAQADRAVRCVVLTGAGRAFCAGGDLEMLRDARQRKAVHEVEDLVTHREGNLHGHRHHAENRDCLREWRRCGRWHEPGPCGRYSHRIRPGAFRRILRADRPVPDFGGTYFLPRIIGPTRAAELFYTAQMLSADDALRLGIVSRVVPAAQLEAETKKLAESIATGAGLAQRDVKHRMSSEQRKDLEAALDEEIRLQRHCFESHDCLEGLNAFFEKRKPNFDGH